jgi:hypothetical protein
MHDACYGVHGLLLLLFMWQPGCLHAAADWWWKYAPLEGVGGVRTPKLDVVELVHRELVAARVVANEIGVANQRNLGSLGSYCTHILIDANSKTIDAEACSPAGVAADLDADAEAALEAVRDTAASCAGYSQSIEQAIDHGDDVHC